MNKQQFELKVTWVSWAIFYILDQALRLYDCGSVATTSAMTNIVYWVRTIDILELAIVYA